MRTHMRTAHGVRVRGVAKSNGETEKVAPEEKPAKRNAIALKAPDAAAFKIVPFVILEGPGGSFWIAEQLSGGVSDLLSEKAR